MKVPEDAPKSGAGCGKVIFLMSRLGVCTMHWNVLALKILLFRTPHQISVHLLEPSIFLIHLFIQFNVSKLQYLSYISLSNFLVFVFFRISKSCEGRQRFASKSFAIYGVIDCYQKEIVQTPRFEGCLKRVEILEGEDTEDVSEDHSDCDDEKA